MVLLGLSWGWETGGVSRTGDGAWIVGFWLGLRGCDWIWRKKALEPLPEMLKDSRFRVDCREVKLGGGGGQ